MGYATKQSRQIESCLKENADRHLTADEVFLLLQEKNAAVGRTTVYRHLEKLYADGVLRKFLGGENDSACFQYVEKSAQCKLHYHLKCTCCGTLFHTECAFLNKLSAHIYQEHGFSVDGSKTVLYGLCRSCANKKKGGD